MEVHWKIRLLRGGGSRKTNIEGGFLKKGGLDSLPNEGGLGKKEKGGVFEGCLLPQCTLCMLYMKVLHDVVSQKS